MDIKPQRVEAPLSNARETLASFGVIGRRNLLGVEVSVPEKQSVQRAGEAAVENMASLEAIPLSRNTWTLLGTIVNEAEAVMSHAVLLVDGKQDVYPVGAALQGWTILRVQRGVVIVEREGKTERLILPGAMEDPMFVQQPDIQKTVSRARLQHELADIATLMRTLTVKPDAIGNSQGMRIMNIQDGSYLSEIGLKKDDLLLAADTTPLTNFGDMAVFAALAKKETVNLELFRDNKKYIIRFDIQK
jgi:type II secretory pathway component PulC